MALAPDFNNLLTSELFVSDILDAFAQVDAADARETSRMYSTEAASIVARLDWSDAELADRIEAALIVGAPFITTTRDDIWTIEVKTDRKVLVSSVAGTVSFAAAAMSTQLLDLHGEFFNA